MKNTIKRLIDAILPFILLGVAVAIFIALFVFFSVILFWGLVIGTVIYLVSVIKNKFFPNKSRRQQSQQHAGRIIEHDDL